MTARLRRLPARWAAWRRDTRGAAAAEFAMVAAFLVIPLLNIVDLSMYAYRRMQVENAADAGAQEVWSLCNLSTDLPAMKNCLNLSAAITTAVQNTTLGASVTQASGSPSEGYYCPTTSSTLLLATGSTASTTVGTAPTPPSPDTCAATSGAAVPSARPGDYVTVTATYSFTSPFAGVSVTSLLPSPITKTTWTRLQ